MTVLKKQKKTQAAAHELKLNQSEHLVAQARSLIAKLGAQREVRDMLIAAVASQNPKDIAAAMSVFLFARYTTARVPLFTNICFVFCISVQVGCYQVWGYGR